MSKFPKSQYDDAIEASQTETMRLKRLRTGERQKAAWADPNKRIEFRARKLGKKLGKRA